MKSISKKSEQRDLAPENITESKKGKEHKPESEKEREPERVNEEKAKDEKEPEKEQGQKTEKQHPEQKPEQKPEKQPEKQPEQKPEKQPEIEIPRPSADGIKNFEKLTAEAAEHRQGKAQDKGKADPEQAQVQIRTRELADTIPPSGTDGKGGMRR